MTVIVTVMFCKKLAVRSGQVPFAHFGRVIVGWSGFELVELIYG